MRCDTAFARGSFECYRSALEIAMYAQPPAQAQATPESPYGTPQYFSSTEVIGAAWEHFKKHAGVLIGATVLMGILMAPFAYTPSILVMTRAVSPISVEFHLTTLVCTLITQVMSAYFSIGFARMGLAIVRHEEPSFGYLFAGKGFGRYLVLSLGLGAISLVAPVIRVVGAAAEVYELNYAAMGWSILSLVPLVLIWLAVSQAHYFMFDKNLGLGEAVRASFAVTKGKRVEIFLASLLGGLLFAAGALACGVGTLVTGPVFMMIFPVIYARLTGQDPNPGGGFGGGYAQPVYYPPQGPGGAPPPAGGYGAPPGGYGGAPPPGGYGQPPGY